MSDGLACLGMDMHESLREASRGHVERLEKAMSETGDASKIHNGAGVDITEAVQILYDIAHSSMDWGSGFLDNEEIETVIRLAILMGWKVPDLPYNSDAMLTVAQKFPEHYEVKEIQIPPSSVYPDGFVRYRVTTR